MIENTDKMSEEFAELINGLIVVLAREAKNRHIDIHKEAKSQNLDDELVEYLDLVMKANVEEGKTNDKPGKETVVEDALPEGESLDVKQEDILSNNESIPTKIEPETEEILAKEELAVIDLLDRSDDPNLDDIMII